MGSLKLLAIKSYSFTKGLRCKLSLKKERETKMTVRGLKCLVVNMSLISYDGDLLSLGIGEKASHGGTDNEKVNELLLLDLAIAILVQLLESLVKHLLVELCAFPNLRMHSNRNLIDF